MPPPLPILMYHKIDGDILRKHLDWLRGKFLPVHLYEIKEYFIQPTWKIYHELYHSKDLLPKIVLTFDDALLDFYISSYSILKDEYDFKATICVPTGFISNPGNPRKLDNWENNEHSTNLIMTWSEIRDISKAKNELGEPLIEILPHSINHVPFDSYGEDIKEVQRQIQESKKTLVLNLSIPEPIFFCLPGGAGWKFDEHEGINHALDKANYIGALRAEYSNEWNRYCIPRYSISSSTCISTLLMGYQRNEV
ncbi:MAG: hypothetical protein A2X25_10155 [Chloroflexi bacterium GWB2_49_20]|nr:MAG: hypothetical protein A2X25_10155 [Chloroflexi bacterium GWB2_49_20]OGN79220.1 MAG: hypothetical protein A2X26_03865 [Chloroflexi bacterium GWC2_49_37]OGN83010.1 MAG: hypothetical protein A2X27_08830 [Chloroflexi bacterium GWD2_49_16]HCC78670.1 hypothetical protein [Anaerolineae bacterium]